MAEKTPHALLLAAAKALEKAAVAYVQSDQAVYKQLAEMREITAFLASQEHTCIKNWPYPDGTSKAICSCGWETDPSSSTDVLNQSFRKHRVFQGMELPQAGDALR